MAGTREATTFPGDVQVRGTLTVGDIKLPNNSVGSGNIDPADPLDAVTLEQQYPVTYKQNKGSAVAAVTESVLHSAYADGVVISACACLAVANAGGATVTLDILKNGTTILSAPWVITTETAYVPVLAAIDPAEEEYLEDDALSIVVTPAAGGGTVGQGLLVQIMVREKAGA